MIKAPYYSQDRTYTCGPAVLRMSLAYFGISKTEEEIIEKIKALPSSGSRHRDLILYAQSLGLSAFYQDNSTIEDIKNYISKEIPVIVNFIEPSNEEGHYALIVGMENGYVVLNDPWNGEGYKISRQEFLKRWRDEAGLHNRSIIVIRE